MHLEKSNRERADMNSKENFKVSRILACGPGRFMESKKTGFLLVLGLALIALPALAALAASNLVAVDVSSNGAGDVVLTLSTSGDEPEVSVFVTESPARIVLDLADTDSQVDKGPVSVGVGAVQKFTTLSAGGRTRLMVDLSSPASYDYQSGNGQVFLTIVSDRIGAAPAAYTSSAKFVVNKVDFRRGDNGQSRVIVGLDRTGSNLSVSTRTGGLSVDIFDTNLPVDLNQRLDVIDFATPVQTIDAGKKGSGVRLELEIAGLYEHMAYQSGDDWVIEVTKPARSELAGDAEVVEFFQDKDYTGSRVTFNFQDIPVRSVLQLIADVSDLNIVVADNVVGNLTLRLTNVPWDQALDIVLDARNLDMRENGNVMWIAPTADIAAREQQLLQALQDRKELEPLQTALLSVSYASAENLKALIDEGSEAADGYSGLLSERGSVAIDFRTNTLMVTDTPDRIEAIQKLVQQLDRPVRQVQIESRIVIANSDFSHELGVRFGVTTVNRGNNILGISGTGLAAGETRLNESVVSIDPNTNTAIPLLSDRYNVNLPATNPSAGGLGLSFLSGNVLLDLELSALEAEGEGEVISTPRVVTANKSEAFIQQGVEIPFEQAASSGATAVQFKEAVLELRVTPLITPDNRVQLELGIKQDTVGVIFQTGRGGSVPSIDTRQLATSVLVRNGETVVLGGIFQDDRKTQEDRIPYLSSIPGVGNLFRRRSNEAKKRELLIFVTPTIVEERPVVN